MDGAVQVQVLKWNKETAGLVPETMWADPEARPATTDSIVEEEPLEIRMGYIEAGTEKIENIAVTMRTPGKDEDLARFFLFTEGIIRHPGDIQRITALGRFRHTPGYTLKTTRGTGTTCLLPNRRFTCRRFV